MHESLALFTPQCPLTGEHLRFNHDLEAFEASLHATFAPPTLVDFSPLSAAPFRQRSTGWGTGSVGVTIGEQSAIRLITAHSDVVRLCIPVRGGSRYRQAEQQAASQAGESWVYLSNQGVHLHTTDDHSGVAFSLDKVQVHHTAQTMRADSSDESADELREISLHSAAAKQAVRMLPALLRHLHEVQDFGADAVKQAEDVAYRFVAYLLADPSAQPREVLTRRRAQQVVDAACSFMMAHLEHPPTLTAVESKVGVSARTLQSAFATCLEASPSDWYRRQRLQVALHLMSTGQVASVTAAALACGFQHMGRFAAEFRTQFGLSPSELRGAVPLA
jgi:AraC-like DNA-binding protein